MNGFRSFIDARSDNRRSGVVVIYIRDELKIQTAEKLEIPGTNALRLEFQEINSDNITSSGSGITIVLLYRDCSASKIKFVEELEEKIKW